MAYDFTGGTNRYLSCSSASASGSPMTISGWLYATSAAGQIIVCSVGVSNLSHRNQLFMQSGGAIQAAAIGASGQDQPSSLSNVTANKWEHCAGVFTSSTSRTPYLNGIAGTTGTTNIGTQNAANQTLINARNNGTSIGIISNQSRLAEVGIWNIALTTSDIGSLADGMPCNMVRPQNLVFYSPLVRELVDVRGGLAITNNNSATVTQHPRMYA